MNKSMSSCFLFRSDSSFEGMLTTGTSLNTFCKQSTNLSISVILDPKLTTVNQSIHIGFPGSRVHTDVARSHLTIKLSQIEIGISPPQPFPNPLKLTIGNQLSQLGQSSQGSRAPPPSATSKPSQTQGWQLTIETKTKLPRASRGCQWASSQGSRVEANGSPCPSPTGNVDHNKRIN